MRQAIHHPKSTRGMEIYTDEEKEIMKNTPIAELRKLAKKLGCTYGAILIKKWKLLNPGKDLVSAKKWKKRNPKKHQKHKWTYYEKSQKARNRGLGWTLFEADYLFVTNLTDEQISEIIGRSVSAIQDMRWKVIKGII